MAEATEELEETVSPDGDNGSPLSGIANKSTLVPVLTTAAAAAAAGLAATKGPDLLKKLSGGADHRAEELGGKAAEGAKQKLGSGGGVMGKAASKLMGGGGGGGQKGGKTRRLPIQRWTDVSVSVNKAYEAWTNFEEFPKFMHRVLEVKPNEDDDKDVIHWREKIWFSTREWDGEIVERRRNDRIAWKSVSGTQHSGVISFHKLDDKLTRVMVDIDFVPGGMIEKMASGMRFVKRAVQADLARYKAYVEFGDVEGLEYKSKPAEMEQHRDGDDKEEQGKADVKHKEDEEQETQASSDNGDGDREEERQERENRREERRKALSKS